MTNRNITFDDLDRAVKAAYKLGLLDGRADVRGQLDDLRQQLANMLKTNKELLRPMLREYKQLDYIKLSPALVKGLLKILAVPPKTKRYFDLKRKYEEATGEEFSGQDGRRNVNEKIDHRPQTEY